MTPMKKHKWLPVMTERYPNGEKACINFCSGCGVALVNGTEDSSCPPWEAQLERETPRPGGLDALGVLKELKFIAGRLDSHKALIGSSRTICLQDAMVNIQQLISRLDGQATDESGVEPKAKENME